MGWRDADGSGGGGDGDDFVVPSICLGQYFPAPVACYNRISLESEKVPVRELHPWTIISDSNGDAPTLVSFTSSSEHF